MDDSKNRKIGAILSYVSIIATTIIQLLYTPLLIRNLGQSEYGLYSLINSIIGYLTILDLGFGNAIVVYTAKYRAQKKYEEEKKLHGMFFIIFCIIGAIAGLVGLALYFNVNNLFGDTMTDGELHKAKILMLILTFNLVISFSFSIYSSILNAYEKFVYQKLMSILNTILRPLIMIPLLFLGFKSITMVVVITVLNVIILISNYLYCKNKLNIKIKYRGFDKKLFITILSYSIWLFLNAIVDKVNWSVDQFILGIVSGTTAVSIYSIATNFNQIFINLSTAISGVLLPKMTKMIAGKKSTEEITNEFIKVGRLQFIVIFLATSGLILFGKEFIIWWAGKEYESSYYVTLLLVVPMLFPLIQNLGLSIMQAMNKFKFRSIATFIMSVFNILISIFLAKQFGAIGAAFGTTIAIVICNVVIMNIYYFKVIKLNVLEFWKNILIMFIKYLIPLSIIVIIMIFTKIYGIKSVIIYGFLYTLIYMLTTYFIVCNSYEKDLIKLFLRKLKIIKKEEKKL